MQTLWTLAGFDTLILRYCEPETRKMHAALGLCIAVNCLLFATGSYHFFSYSVRHGLFLPTVVSLLTLIFLGFNRMLLATHDYALAAYDQTRTLAFSPPGFSAMLRLLILALFSAFAATGLLFWITNTLFEDYLLALCDGRCDPAAVEQLTGRPCTDPETLRTFCDRLLVTTEVLTPWKPLIALHYLVVALLLCFPVLMKFYLKEVSLCDYELTETDIEARHVVSHSMYTNQAIQQMRQSMYGLPRRIYESHYDPPFNTRRRFPPLDITIEPADTSGSS
jgi:hypothetical protein